MLPTGTMKAHHDLVCGAHEVNSTDSCQYHSGGHGGIRAAWRTQFHRGCVLLSEDLCLGRTSCRMVKIVQMMETGV